MQFLDDKRYKGSAEFAIRQNLLADKNNVSKSELEEIANKLRNEVYRFYDVKEPLYGWQQEIQF